MSFLHDRTTSFEVCFQNFVTLNMTQHVLWLSQLPLYQWKTLQFVYHTWLPDEFRISNRGTWYVTQVYFKMCGFVRKILAHVPIHVHIDICCLCLQNWMRVTRSASNDSRGTKWFIVGIWGRETLVPGDHTFETNSKGWMNSIRKNTPTENCPWKRRLSVASEQMEHRNRYVKTLAYNYSRPFILEK